MNREGIAGIKCSDIIAFMEETAPAELAEEWDNTGLLVGRSDKPVSHIMLCMDVTGAVAEEAVSRNTDLLISHHPLIFKGMKRIIQSDPKGKIINKLIRNDIGLFTAHTNLDAAKQGVNFCLAEKLGLHDIRNLKETKDVAGYEYGLGKVGLLENVPFNDFMALVKRKLETKSVRVIGHPPEKIRRVSVFCGSFDDDLEVLKHMGADITVTGDLKYHTAVDAYEMGICIVDAGHFNTEKIVLPVLAGLVSARFPRINVFCSKVEKDPFITY